VNKPATDSLTARVHAELRAELMHGRLQPGQRLKIRDLARAMGVSETPVREAVMQLVREGALELRHAAAIRVARLDLSGYLELRQIRLRLEGLAAEEAARRATTAAVAALEAEHALLVAAEAAQTWQAAIEANFRFHHGLWRLAAMPHLLAILEGIWLRNGPLLNLLYPDAMPSYAGRHRHLDILDGLRARDAEHTRVAVHADLIEGGRGLLRRLEALECESP
jgi:DNA-binding GntR family transcriptional regulator